MKKSIFGRIKSIFLPSAQEEFDGLREESKNSEYKDGCKNESVNDVLIHKKIPASVFADEGKIDEICTGDTIKKFRVGVCKICLEKFYISMAEIEFYASKGFNNLPSRCPSCRAKRKERSNEKYAAVCAACGKDFSLPFPPREDRLCYCNVCFAKMR